MNCDMIGDIGVVGCSLFPIKKKKRVMGCMLFDFTDSVFLVFF